MAFVAISGVAADSWDFQRETPGGECGGYGASVGWGKAAGVGTVDAKGVNVVVGKAPPSRKPVPLWQRDSVRSGFRNTLICVEERRFQRRVNPIPG
jgi:hypothetical protein